MDTLYRIDEAIREICELPEEEVIDMETGEVLRDIWSEIEKLGKDRKTKITNTALVIRKLTEEAAAARIYARQISERAKAKENRAEMLKAMLGASMFTFGDKTVEDERIRVTATTSKSVYVSPDAELPPEYVRVKTTSEADKTKIAEALKKGVEISGAAFIEKPSVRIK